MKQNITLFDLNAYLAGVVLPEVVPGFITPAPWVSKKFDIYAVFYVFTTSPDNNVMSLFPFMTFRITELLPPRVGDIKGVVLWGLMVRGGLASIASYAQGAARIEEGMDL